MGLGRFELPTSRLSGVRSNQLSYRPIGPTEPSGLGLLNSFIEGIRRQRPVNLVSFDIVLLRYVPIKMTGTSLKGGDPAAGSPTATLLRLHPSR